MEGCDVRRDVRVEGCDVKRNVRAEGCVKVEGCDM